MRAHRIAPLLLLLAPAAGAGDFTWPGPAPCATTLQACIDAAAAGDRIRVASDGPIDQHLSIARSVRLLPEPGYRPRLAAGRRITATASGAADLDLRLRGFALPSGSITVAHSGSGALNASLQDLEITAEPGREAIRIDASGAGPVGVVVENVALRLDGATGTDGRPALRVTHAGSGLFDGIVAALHVVARGPGSASAVRVDTGPAAASLDLAGIRIDGSALAGGIDVVAGGGPLALNLISNAIVGDGAATDLPALAAIRVDAGGATATVNALNNTTIGTPRGIALAGSALGGAAQNNLVAFHPVRGMDLPPAFANRNNLVSANGSDVWTPGPGTRAVDPRLVDVRLPRLRADSPAIDAGDRTLLDAVTAARALPALDVDGLRRFKGVGATVDIGAFEHGDAVVSHVAGLTNSALYETWFSDPSLDGQPQQLPLAMARRNGTAALFGAAGLFYGNGPPSGVPPQRWALRDGSLLFVPEGAVIDLWVPALGGAGAVFAPVVGEGSGALLDVDGLNGNPLAILFVTARVADAWAPGLFMARPVEVSYDATAQRWRVDNVDGTPLGANPAFNVYWQAESANAYVHEAAAPNLAGAATVLSHPLLDANPCARPIVQLVRAEGVVNAHPLVTAYDAGRARWTVENRTGVAMPPGATFNVLVLPAQAETCAAALFADGFE